VESVAAAEDLSLGRGGLECPPTCRGQRPQNEIGAPLGTERLISKTAATPQGISDPLAVSKPVGAARRRFATRSDGFRRAEDGGHDRHADAPGRQALGENER
jgi:hypothetical protein